MVTRIQAFFKLKSDTYNRRFDFYEAFRSNYIFGSYFIP